MKVCEKVKMKCTTLYDEVADELVAEPTDPRYNNLKYIYIFPRQIVNYFDIKSQSYQAFHVEIII